jgi:ribosomal protein S18 acetylase RimI-like enzyme
MAATLDAMTMATARRSWRPAALPTAPTSTPLRRRRLVAARRPRASASSSTSPLLTLDFPSVGARLEVSALDPTSPDADADAAAAAVLITRAFAGTAEEVRLSDSQLFSRRLLEVGRAAAAVSDPQPPPALLLLARLHVSADSAASADNDNKIAMPPGRSSRVAGVACLSLASGDGSRAEMVPGSEGVRLPPEDEPYLFNVAVDPKLRRMGVATALVRAAEQRALVVGGGDENKKSMWLHVRQADPAAQALYAQAGYVEAGRDAAATTAAKVGGLFGGLFGGGGQPASASASAPPPRPRILLKKELLLP